MLRGIQREIYPWFEASRDRFAVPVTIGRRVRYPKRLRKHEWLELKVVTPGYTFRPVLSSHGLRVPVFHDNELWDNVWGIDMIRPRRVAGGYVSPVGYPGGEKVYPTPGAQWRERVFEPFLSWVNLELAPASWLAFYREGDATWVELVQVKFDASKNKSLVHLVELKDDCVGCDELECDVKVGLAQFLAGAYLTAEESLARIQQNRATPRTMSGASGDPSRSLVAPAGDNIARSSV